MPAASTISRFSEIFKQTFGNVSHAKTHELTQLEKLVLVPLENYKNVLKEINGACYRRGLLLEAYKLQRADLELIK